MNRTAAWFAILLGACMTAPLHAQTPAMSPWDQAYKTWESAMSQYRSGIYSQAAGLFEEFVKKYPHHEYVGGSLIYLANCKWNLKDPNGWEAALDQVIKKFPNGGPWFVAYMARLNRAKTAKDGNEYVALLESMLRTAKELPLDLTGAYVNTPYGVWYQYNRNHRATGEFPWLAEPLRPPGMEKDLVEMCDTAPRAEKALRALALTFRNGARQLPPEWEFTHYMLLKQAGKEAEAGKTLKGYLDEWGSDPRGIGLWVLQGEYAQDAGDDATADAAYAHLVQNYDKYASLSVYLGPRLDYLKKKDRLADYATLAEFYCKTWPRGALRDKVLNNWLALLRPRAIKGDADALAKAASLLEEFLGKDSSAGLKWLLDVSLELKKAPEALALARKLSLPAHWSSQTFDLLQKSAAKDAGLQAVVDEARKKYGIPVEDGNSPAAALLKQLEARIQDDQTRHMEELGDELVQKHAEDAATILAVKKLVDYYFTKLLPEPRDKWIGRMITSYKLHPLTQEVLVAQATALNASKKYAELAVTLDALAERFPTAPYRYWMEQRLSCFDAAKDVTGKAAFARKHFGAAADAGDLDAIKELAKHELPLLGSDSKKIGDYWMEKAKKAAGTTGELYCLWRAVDGYCYLWTPPWQRDKERKFLWAEGLTAMKEALARKQDPEFTWCLQFGEADLLSEKRDGKGAVTAAQALLTEKKYRDLTYRLNLEALATALADPNVAREGLAFGDKLAQACYSEVDQSRIHAFRARMFGALDDTDQAAKSYMKIVELCPWPAKVLGAATSAIHCVRGNPGAANSLAESYLSKGQRIQDLVIPVWLTMAEDCFRGNRGAFNQIAGRLASQYPASLARGRVVKMVQDEQARQRQP